MGDVLLTDKRRIESLYFPGPAEDVITVGVLGVTKIVPVSVNGEMAPTVWFEVWEGDNLVQRVNGRWVESVSYYETNNGGDE